jgi:hypothetical protein
VLTGLEVGESASAWWLWLGERDVDMLDVVKLDEDDSEVKDTDMLLEALELFDLFRLVHLAFIKILDCFFICLFLFLFLN